METDLRRDLKLRSKMKRNLVHSVDDGMAGVSLDGGEDSFTGRSSCGKRSSSSKRSSSIGSSWESSTSVGDSWEASREGKSCREGIAGREGSRKGSSDWGSGVNVGNNLSGSGSIDTRGTEETSSVGVDDDGSGGSLNLSGSNLILSGLTLLPLLSGSSSGSGISGSKSLEVGGLGSGYLCSVLGGDGKGKVEDWGDKGSDLRDSGGDRGDRQVGGRDPKSVDRVGDILGGLEETVGVNVLVGAGGDAVGIPGLSAGKGTTSVAERELSELILSMELRSSSWCGG